MRVRDRLGITDQRQNQVTHVMEIGLIVLFFLGMERGSVGVMVNCAVGLLVIQLPPLLERDYGVPMDPALTLWITSAAFLHALGTVGIPGTGATFYRTIGWWDHMTHALSSSLVAGAGYATVRAIEEHSETIYLPGRFMFVFILMFVMAFGVFWEVVEFAIAEVALATGAPRVLTQYSLEDTMKDLLFNLMGGVIVAVWGTAHLTDVVSAIERRLDTRSGTE
ncbi:DUF2238 domain-containing protein [Halostella sp. JP-L12]|uniref:hypothetical protein n=1 Tax=Halostella TaxID=1843185 RepID=UPI000EF7DD91|nr:MULTISPECIES: hypothetical protein [Halostella]NHN48591.1 DUF2238 domain-containing protein [Halostella sp. JP-L12]